MAVKYVKDFAFDSGFGFTGSSGKTPVRGYMRGGAVKEKGFDNSTRNPMSKFPDIAPAMVGKGPGKMGGKTSDVKPLSKAKASPQIAKYAKGGKVKKTHAKKEVPSFLKGKMMKKADGGMIPIAEEAPKVDLPIVDLPMVDIPAADEFIPLPKDPTRSAPIKSMPVKKMPVRRNPEAEAAKRAASDMRSRPPLTEFSDLEQAFGRRILRPGMEEPQMLVEAPSVPAPRKSVKDDADYGSMPIGVMGGGKEYWNPGGGKDRQAEATRKWRESQGLPAAPSRSRQPPPPETLARSLQAEAMNQFKEAQRMNQLLRSRMGRPRTDRRGMSLLEPIDEGMMMDRTPVRRPPPRLPYSETPMFSPTRMRNPRAPTSVPTFAKGGKVSKGERKIGKVMGEFKRGELHSGSKEGPVVTNPKQAKAIALSEARAAGAKIPKKAEGGGIKAAVHKHERSKHPGKPLTKLRKGGIACG